MVELSSLDVRFLALELAHLEDAYVDKVYETSPGTFLIRARHPSRGRANLVLAPGRVAALVEESPETPEAPGPFVSLLRKHLAGTRIRRVEQHAFDRVLVIHLDQRGDALRLVVELFGKGNLVLVGAEDATVLSQRTETFRDRSVKRGEPFRFPPSRVNPILLARDEFDDRAREAEKDGIRFLATDLAMGPDLAEELVHRARLDKTRRARDWSQDDRDRLWKAWTGIVHAPAQPQLARNAAAVRVEAIPFQTPKFGDYERTTMQSISQAIESALRHEAQQAPVPRNEEHERLARQLAHQETALDDLAREAELWERRGRGVYESYAELEKILADARARLEAAGWGGLDQDAKAGRLDERVEVDAKAQRLIVRFDWGEVPLDLGATLERNASTFFDEAKRVKQKRESAQAALAETKRLLEATPERKIVAAPARPKSTRRFWFESFRWCYTTQGLLVVGGRDAGSNDRVVKKHLGPGDLYFHADVHGAPSCILKTAGQEPTEESLREAAQFAAAYSKAFVQFGSADAYWVRPEQVSKTAPTGEFVPRGAFIVRGQRNPVPRLPMEVAVGIIELTQDGRPQGGGPERRLVGGARESLAKWSPSWIVVKRGDTAPAEIVRGLGERFQVPMEAVQAVLPAGPLRLEEPTKEAAE